MAFSVARTGDEAHLFLDLHPCECGAIDVTWQKTLVNVGGQLLSRYSGSCDHCAVEREFLFALPQQERLSRGYPTFGGSEPSQLLDAGEWLWVADLAASNAFGDDSDQAIAVARASIDEVVKFIPPDGDEVPAEAFWSQRGREVRAASPKRFSRDHLLSAREGLRADGDD